VVELVLAQAGLVGLGPGAERRPVGVGFLRAAQPSTREDAPVQHEALRPVVERARAGDEAAFAELFRLHAERVARACRRLLGAGPAAEDAAAEVFLRARRALGAFEPERPFEPWLLAIASHHCIDVLRRRRTEARLFDASETDTGQLVDPGPSALRRITGAEERDRVLAAIEALPERYRLPLVLRYWSELDYAAIGELLGATREQVGTLLFRAKRLLRERLAPGPGAEDA
jgi:RNA polymerase sigma-70 factor (ECF subfamily)